MRIGHASEVTATSLGLGILEMSASVIPSSL